MKDLFVLKLATNGDGVLAANHKQVGQELVILVGPIQECKVADGREAAEI